MTFRVKIKELLVLRAVFMNRSQESRVYLQAVILHRLVNKFTTFYRRRNTKVANLLHFI